jgi:AmmeMemoRadiSam system protein B|tara:strand:- start:947 stop:2185 length:1239 start_codon:yes stop_codon:yes gene_type:complete
MARQLPVKPHLRDLSPRWIQRQDGVFLHLEDDLGLAKTAVQIPQNLTPILLLCDGTRALPAINGALLLQGISIGEKRIYNLIEQLDDALLLENGKFAAEKVKAIQKYRNSKHRPMSFAGTIYPSTISDLDLFIEESKSKFKRSGQSDAYDGVLQGLLSPHIDFARGYGTYAELWKESEEDLDGIEQVVILGTDHSGGLGSITPTMQNYQTPYSELETDLEGIKLVETAISGKDPYNEELHHLKEHSIELALTWLHNSMEGKQFKLLPILCGSFQKFIIDKQQPDSDETINNVIDSISEYRKRARTLVIAAGDLAHVGPEFGDETTMDELSLADLASKDHISLASIEKGDPDNFFQTSAEEADVRKICGLAPIYLMGKILSDCKGYSVGYDQCPADQNRTSFVSIAGTLLFGE